MSDTSTRRAKLEIGRVFSTTFAVVGRNLKAFGLIIFALTILPSLLIEVVRTTLKTGSSVTNGYMLLMGVFGLIAAVITALQQGALIHLTIADLSGRTASVREGLTRGVRTMLPLVFIAILYFLGAGIGFLLIIVPGIVLALIWCVAGPAYVIEDQGIWAAFRRSGTLTKGSRWRLLGLFLILGIIFYAIEFGAIGLFGGFATIAKAQRDLSSIPFLMTSTLINAAIGLIASPGHAVLYSELRRIKDGVGAGDLAAVFD